MKTKFIDYRPKPIELAFLVLVSLFCFFDFYSRIWSSVELGNEVNSDVTATESPKSASQLISKQLKSDLINYFSEYGVALASEISDVNGSISEESPLDKQSQKRFTSIGDNSYRLIAVFTTSVNDAQFAILEKSQTTKSKRIEVRAGETVDNLNVVNIQSRMIVLAEKDGTLHTLPLFPLQQSNDTDSKNKVVNDE